MMPELSLHFSTFMLRTRRAVTEDMEGGGVAGVMGFMFFMDLGW